MVAETRPATSYAAASSGKLGAARTASERRREREEEEAGAHVELVEVQSGLGGGSTATKSATARGWPKVEEDVDELDAEALLLR